MHLVRALDAADALHPLLRKRQRIRAGSTKYVRYLDYSFTHSTNICQNLALILDRWVGLPFACTGVEPDLSVPSLATVSSSLK